MEEPKFMEGQSMNNPVPPVPAAPKFSWPRLMIKLDRLAALILLFVIIAYGVTGYAMTKGVLNGDLARLLHLGWLGAIGLIAFVIHTAWALHLACKRNNIWNCFTKTMLTGFYIILAAFFLYLHFFYSPARLSGSYRSGAVTPVTEANPIFTAASLAAYDGLNGRPAYVAVDGLVYDLSSVFRGGNHHGYSAGQDLSAAFHGQHSDRYLQGYPIVGTYQAN